VVENYDVLTVEALFSTMQKTYYKCFWCYGAFKMCIAHNAYYAALIEFTSLAKVAQNIGAIIICACSG